MERGNPGPLGAWPDKGGSNFSLYSSVAERVELCLFDESGAEIGRHDLPARTDNTWHGYLAGCREGQRYGYRVHGPYQPLQGLRCNPYKLLVDPYTKLLAGEFRWHDAVFDFEKQADGSLAINSMDSAPFVPKSVVCGAQPAIPDGPSIAWPDTVFYETNLRGFTMRHPAVPAAERGTFRGMRNKQVIAYLKSLGVTSIELLPLQAFIDEHHLHKLGLHNYWGYNSIAYFAPHSRDSFADAGNPLAPIAELRDMVRAIHEAGMEVILDVVYNHTGESDFFGPSITFRGIDNLAYYRTGADAGSYVNDSGCGNVLEADSEIVQRLVVDSLRYWTDTFGIDGFRFDLAPILGRHAQGYSPGHPLLAQIAKALPDSKLVAEPWDPGPGGYQLGRFLPGWAEWNDRYRDTVRRFWRGDDWAAAEFAARIEGSADLFGDSRSLHDTVNFVTSHDGFTLRDVVSYAERHNHANGEENRDGHPHNFSRNYGIEGDTDDESVNELRRQQRLNMLATLLLSRGTPMLLAGDEFGHTQHGNNNAYAQDNQIGWTDWSGLDADPEFATDVCRLLTIRRELPFFRNADADLRWYRSDGTPMRSLDWDHARAMTALFRMPDEPEECRAALCINAWIDPVPFVLPAITGVPWQRLFSSGQATETSGEPELIVAAHSLVMLAQLPGTVSQTRP